MTTLIFRTRILLSEQQCSGETIRKLKSIDRIHFFLRRHAIDTKMTRFVIFFILITEIIYVQAQGGKYSKERNNAQIDDPLEGRQFRMIKIQQLWEKAKKRLSGTRLADCYAELKVQDKMHYDLKRLKHKDPEKGELKDLSVQKQLQYIMGKYNLGEHPDMKKLNLATISDQFLNKDLKKLWKNAQYSGFTEEELKILEEEFHHHQKRLDEYDALRDELVRLEKTALNALENGDDLDSARQLYKQKNKETKIKHKQINEGFQSLEKRIYQDESHPHFTDFRVYQLYAMAKKTNMSSKELESFEEELKQFQRRIDKHETLKDMVRQSKSHFDKTVKGGNYPPKHTELEDKANVYDYKVKKYHDELHQRVDKLLFHHTEL